MGSNSIDENEIAIDFSPIFRVHKDGQIERVEDAPLVLPTVDPETGVSSYDVVVSSQPDLKARVFIPKLQNSDDQKKLPLLIHYHGGGFSKGSPFNTLTQNFLTPLVAQTNSIAISIEYRLAPENPLPIAFHDCWAGFQWVASHQKGSGPDPVITKYADFGRVYIGGESGGATIAQHVAVKASTGIESIDDGLSLRGLIIIHPFFAEREADEIIKYIYPTGSATDENPFLNPAADPDLAKMGCSKVMVFLAEKDYFKGRGLTYVETLKKSQWEGSVEVVETEGEDHCFHFYDPTRDKAKAMVQKMASFIIQDR